MKCIILAAGYATRLYPLTENFPKPLLEVGGKPILDWLTEDLAGKIDGFIAVSNHKFAEHFKAWAKKCPYEAIVLDDGSVCNEDRLGAVRDIQFAIDALQINDDTLVIAGDNLLDFSLTGFVSYALKKNASCVMRYYEPDTEKLKKCGVATIGENDIITKMEEKPQVPQSNWCCPPFYFYAKKDLPLVKRGIEEGCGTDAPGSFVCWLASQTPVFAMEMPGRRYDIGNLASYEAVKREYKGITKGAKQ